jgi:hypothetical protein
MIEKLLWQRFWLDLCTRWSVQERVQTSFCPIAHQVMHYSAWELCRQIAAWILSRLTPFLLMWGVRKGGLGGGWGPKIGRACLRFFLRLLWFFDFEWKERTEKRMQTADSRLQVSYWVLRRSKRSWVMGNSSCIIGLVWYVFVGVSFGAWTLAGSK